MPKMTTWDREFYGLAQLPRRIRPIMDARSRVRALLVTLLLLGRI